MKCEVEGLAGIKMRCPVCGKSTLTYDYTDDNMHIFTCKAGATWIRKPIGRGKDKNGKTVMKYGEFLKDKTIRECPGREEV